MAEWYENVDTRGYENMSPTGTQAWPEYNPNLFRGVGVGRFDMRNMMRPTNLTPDMGASAYQTPSPATVYPGQRNIHEGFGTADVSSTFPPPEKKGFNFSLPGPLNVGIGWLKEKFQRPEAKQIAYDQIMGSLDDKGYGTYKGNQYRFADDPATGLKKVYSEVNPWGKNFDSMFGSKSLEEMDQKTLDWAMNRINKGKNISERLRNILINRGMYTPPTGVDLTTITDPGKGGPTVTTGGAAVTTGGGGTFNPTLDVKGRGDRGGDAAPSWHGATRERGELSRATGGKQGQVAGPGFGRGAYWADGGRVGYKRGRVVNPGGYAGEEEFEDENIFEFMRDQNVPHSEMVEGEEDFLLREEYNKYLFEMDELGLEPMSFEDFRAQAMMAEGPEESFSEEGIASRV